MGYKTKDPKEVKELQKKGNGVVGIRQISEGLEYEFDFEMETQKEVLSETQEDIPNENLNEESEFKPEPKKRGRKKLIR